MVEDGDDDGSSPPSPPASPSPLMKRVFDLADAADAADHTLANDNALVRKLLGSYFSEGAGSLDSSPLIEEACDQLWGRVAGMGCRPPDGWTGTVIMSLFLLAGGDRGQELSVQLWRAVAHPAERMHEGLGRFIMRRAAAAATGTSTATAATAASVERRSVLLPPVLLRDFVVATLRRGGHPAPLVAQQRNSRSGQGSGGGGKEDGGGAGAGADPNPVQYGLRLSLFVASHILENETSLQANSNGPAAVPAAAAATWETWRWNVHLEVCLRVFFFDESGNECSLLVLVVCQGRIPAVFFARWGWSRQNRLARR